ncbi:DNA starvation/stationary phase protection protein [Methylocystis sp. 9N]|uniref:DNA starvation/stationary phase protection protein n=1 Tax=Methylocystis borbori TaxID=3118750 RepID=A0ABU7XHM3_9HYPH
MSKTRTPASADTQRSALDTPTDLEKQSTLKIAEEINKLVADALALYLKTKNFHWHMSGPHFRDYHLLLDEQATQIYASVDPLAERVRKLGQPTLRSIGHISQLARIKDNNADFVAPYDMLCELLEDNKGMAEAMRGAHKLCEDNEDIATASLLEVYVDETEKRTWFLFEAARGASPDGH